MPPFCKDTTNISKWQQSAMLDFTFLKNSTRYNTRMKLFYRKASGPISDKVVVSLPGLREQDLTRLGPKSNSHQRCPSLMMTMMIMTMMFTMMMRRKGTWTQVKLSQALSRFVV